MRAIMLTGAGKGFCWGAQLGRRHVSPRRRRRRSRAMDARLAQPDHRKGAPLADLPVVVAVNGAAAGAGVGLALMGDIVIAARSARFILSFSSSAQRSTAARPPSCNGRSGRRARGRWLSWANRMTAEAAAEWGLIWKVVDDGELMGEAFGLAARLAEGPPVAIRLIKAQLEAAWTAPLPRRSTQRRARSRRPSPPRTCTKARPPLSRNESRRILSGR